MALMEVLPVARELKVAQELGQLAVVPEPERHSVLAAGCFVGPYCLSFFIFMMNIYDFST